MHLRSLRRRFGPLLLPLLTLSVLPATLTGQEQTSAQPESKPAEVAEPSLDLSADSVQAQIMQVEAATDLPENVKTELLTLYRQALDQLTVASTWDAKIAEYRKKSDEAPPKLEVTKNRLAELSAPGTTAPDLDVSPDTPLDELTQRLANAEAELKSKQDAAKSLEDEARRRSDRRAAIPDLLADANERLERTNTEAGETPPQSVPPRVAQARRLRLTAQKRALESEIQAYDEELRSYSARSDYLVARRDVAKLETAAARVRVDALQSLVTERREADVKRQQEQAEQELRQAPKPIRELAEQNAGLAQERAELIQKLTGVKSKTQRVTEIAERLAKDFESLQEKVGDPGVTEFIGPRMRKYRSELETLRGYSAEIRIDRRELARARVRLSFIEEKRYELTDSERRVTEILETLAESAESIRIARIEPRVRTLLNSQRDALDQLKTDYDTYWNDLNNLIDAEGKLNNRVAAFREFVESHVLWMRSAGPLYTVRLPGLSDNAAALWTALSRSLIHDLREYWFGYGCVAVVVMALLLARFRLRASLAALSQKVARAATDSFAFTLAALVETLLLAIPWPIALAFLGWRVLASVDATDATVYGSAAGIGSGLQAAARALFTVVLALQICRVKGLAESHFRWDANGLQRSRQSIFWLGVVCVPAVSILYATEAAPPLAAWRDSVGRIALIVAMGTFAWFAHRILHPRTGALAPRFRRKTSDWVYQFRHLLLLAGILLPVLVAIASFLGYHFTAIQFAQHTANTVKLIVLLLVLHAMLVRWLFVAQRRLALAEAEKLKAAAEARAAEEKPSEATHVDESRLNLVQIGDQTRKLLRALVLVGLVIGIWMIWAGTLPALSFLDDVELWSHTVTVAAGGEGAAAGAAQSVVKYVTLADLGLAVILALVTLVLAKNIPGLLEVALLQRLPLDAGGRFAVTTLVRYAITLVGIVLAFGAIGIGWSQVQWLAAAITVGLGFGLQEIFANFVSGLILLFERPIRIGDTVTVGNISGDVTRIRIRATTIRDWDRKELVIPNKEFVTGQVVNWTLSDPILRVIVPVGIAYGSDTALAEELLFKIARENEHVLDDPKPRVLFMGFGDSSLDFELRVFIPSIDYFLKTRHNLNKAIDAEFRKANIEIAFPQRDIHVRSIKAALPVAADGKPGALVEGLDPSQIRQTPPA